MNRPVLRAAARLFAVLVAVYWALGGAALGQPQLHASAAYWVRGIYRFSFTGWSTLAADGFNWSTDGGTNTNNYAGQKAAGLRGMVWLDAYNNSTCAQTMSDAQITSVVRTNVGGGNAGAVYQVGDEPTTNGCNAAPTYSHITAVIHAADGSAKSWVADDQFNDPSISHWPAGVPMKGSVDILALDVYPCVNWLTACEYSMIDQAVQRIHSVGLRNWEFILQDFGACQSWRKPSAAEVTAQFNHWYNAGALGYWIYAYDTDPGGCAGNVAGSAELKTINGAPVNYVAPPKPAASPPPAPKPTPKPSSAPIVTPSPKVSPKGPSTPPSVANTPAPSPVAAVQHEPSSRFFTSADVLPLTIAAVGAVLAVIAAALWLARRRRRPRA